jgi:hypothetical protein
MHIKLHQPHYKIVLNRLSCWDICRDQSSCNVRHSLQRWTICSRYAYSHLHIKYFMPLNVACLSGTWADSTTYKCVTSCPPGYFADSTGSVYVCRTTCSNTSEFGHPLTRACVPVSGCAAPYVYADSTSRQCVTVCPVTASTYGNNGTWTCSGTCTGSFPLKDPSTQTCVANCPSNPSLYADSAISGSCVTVCPTIYFAVEASRTC